jgi:integrase
LTDKFVKNAPPPTDRPQVDYWDAATPGFGLRVTSEGVKTWTIIYRVDGKQVRQSLGRYDGVSLADARKKAADIREMLDRGKDPRLEAERERRKEQQARADTVAMISDQYLKAIGVVGGGSSRRKKRVLRQGDEIKRIHNKYIVPKFGDRPVADISRRELADWLDSMADRAPVMANRVLGRLSRFFDWATARDIIPASPAAGIERPEKEVPRDRLLTDAEVREIWTAAGEIGFPYGRMVQFMLLTATRLQEATHMQRDEISGDIWTIPAKRQKSNVDHAIPLPPPAIKLLDELPTTGHWVFPSWKTGRPIGGTSSYKMLLDSTILANRQKVDSKAKPMPDWVLHDFRRVVRSGMSALRIDAEVAERCLGHVPKGLRRVYDRHTFLSEKRHAFAAWAQQLQSIVNPRPPASVVMLRKTQHL